MKQKDIITEVRSLYQQFVNQINSIVGGKPLTEVVTPIDSTLSLSINSQDLFSSIYDLQKQINDITNSVEFVRDIVVIAGIISGLEVTVVEEDNIKVTAGSGITDSKKYFKLDYDVTIPVDLPQSVGEIYILLNGDNNVIIRDAQFNDALTIGKIVIQKSYAVRITDDMENTTDCYIYSSREETFANDFKINDATKPTLLNFLQEILASNLIGEIKLSEGLTLSNTRGTMQASSEDITFYSNDGDEIAKYGGYEARVGNIIIETDNIHSRNFNTGASGFQIHKDGDIEANDVTVRGTIYATLGEIGGWKINSTSIYSDTAGDDIIIDSDNVKIESSNYVTGYNGSGFHLSSDLFEVGNIACRGVIRTAVFQKDVMSAVGGNIVVLPADVLNSDMSSLDSASLTIEGNETFANSDILRIKDGFDDEWLEVTDASGAPTYICNRDKNGSYASDNNPIWKKGATVVNYKQSGDGFVYMTASASNAPYLSVHDHAGSPWSSINTRLRLGNLNGYLGYVSDIYGLGIGSSSAGEANLTFDATNGIRLRSGTTDEIVIDNSGNVYIAGTVTIGGSGGVLASSVDGWKHASDVTKIDGGDIYTNTVTATQINVSQLSAISADMGSLTAGTITGGTLQTASSGARTIMNTSGIECFDSSSNSIFKFRTGTPGIGENWLQIAGAMRIDSTIYEIEFSDFYGPHTAALHASSAETFDLYATTLISTSTTATTFLIPFYIMSDSVGQEIIVGLYLNSGTTANCTVEIYEYDLISTPPYDAGGDLIASGSDASFGYDTITIDVSADSDFVQSSTLNGRAKAYVAKIELDPGDGTKDDARFQYLIYNYNIQGFNRS